MQFFKRLIDLLTLGSDRPVRRLVAYYAFLSAIAFILYQFVPPIQRLFAVMPADTLGETPTLLQDGLAETITGASSAISSTGAAGSPVPTGVSRLEFAIVTLGSFLGVMLLMLPVSWVYMSVAKERRHNPAVAQTLILLPLVVAGVVLIVQNSLALAFCLAGVVAAVRFRTTLSDTRETVFIFLAIAVGFAAGVQVMTVAAVLSILFNFTLLFIWRYDFGRNILDPSPVAQWSEPLSELAKQNGAEVPDRDLVLALTPKKVDVLAERFNRINKIIGSNGSKPRYNAVATIRTSKVTEAQRKVENALDDATKRWRLDEVITNTGKPSTIYYLVRTRRSVGRDGLITAIRANAAGVVDDIEVELGEAAVKEREKAEKSA